jgi:hypothetical protein
VRSVGGSLLALAPATNQNNGADVQGYDPTSGNRVGSKPLPRPIHHLIGSSMAVDAQGGLLYPSSDSGSQDSLGRVRVTLPPKGSLQLDTLAVAADTTEAPKKTGFKLQAVAAHGDSAFGALFHEAQGELRLIEYPLPGLKGVRALATVPFVGSRGDISSIAADGRHILVAGRRGVTVFAREGDSARLLGVLPVRDVDDIRLRPDGGVDLVLNDHSFTTDWMYFNTKKEWRVLRLSPSETQAIFFKPFGTLDAVG